jgi:hypothetical protein
MGRLWWGVLLVLGLALLLLWWAWPREEPTLVYFVHWDEKCNSGSSWPDQVRRSTRWAMSLRSPREPASSTCA